MGTPSGNPPVLPLTPALRAAYEDLYNQLEAQYEATHDTTVRMALEPAKDNVDDLLTKDNICQLQNDTAAFEALAGQIGSTNDGLKTLQGQIASTASHFAMAGQILGAVNKVFGLLGIA